jgi:hypothetical protein
MLSAHHDTHSEENLNAKAISYQSAAPHLFPVFILGLIY